VVTTLGGLALLGAPALLRFRAAIAFRSCRRRDGESSIVEIALTKANSSCFSIAPRTGGPYSSTTAPSYPLKDQRSSTKQDYSSAAVSTPTYNSRLAAP
jgi:hypothetical protein